MTGFFDIYSIIFLVIAVVIFMRLGSVLGRRTGNEPSPYDGGLKNGAAASRNDNVVSLPSREPIRPGAAAPVDNSSIERHAAAGTPLYESLVELRSAMPDFDPEHFLQGARMAYEMVVTAFADGDRATLKNLLAADVFDGFLAAIAEREARGEKAELTFVGIDEAKIAAAELDGRIAKITIRFSAELISVTRDGTGAVVDGDPTEVQNIRDVWTFARDITARDPNWKLVATDAV